MAEPQVDFHLNRGSSKLECKWQRERDKKQAKARQRRRRNRTDEVATVPDKQSEDPEQAS